MKHPLEEHSIFHFDIIDDVVDDSLDALYAEFLDLLSFDFDHLLVSCSRLDNASCSICLKISDNLSPKHSDVSSNLHSLAVVSDDICIGVKVIQSASLLPSIGQLPKLELKQLPEHLKYTYLEDGE